MGEDRQTGTLLSAQAPTMVRLAWGHSSLITNRGGIESPHKGNQQVQNGVQGGTQNNRGSNSLQCFRCQGWGHMARECATLATSLNREEGTQGMWSNPPPTTNSKF